jgi:hypothetical protein
MMLSCVGVTGGWRMDGVDASPIYGIIGMVFSR